MALDLPDSRLQLIFMVSHVKEHKKTQVIRPRPKGPLMHKLCAWLQLTSPFESERNECIEMQCLLGAMEGLAEPHFWNSKGLGFWVSFSS